MFQTTNLSVQPNRNREIVKQFPTFGLKEDIVTFNILMKNLCRHRDVRKAAGLWRDILDSSLAPTAGTISPICKMFVDDKQYEQYELFCQELFSSPSLCHLAQDPTFINTRLRFLTNVGNAQELIRYWRTLPEKSKDVVHYLLALQYFADQQLPAPEFLIEEWCQLKNSPNLSQDERDRIASAPF